MKYDENKYKVQQLPHPVLVHWILNPGLAINEVFLGQRIPKVLLIDKTSDEALANRNYVPCPSCGIIHSGKLWGRSNAFGHWLGFICPNCEKIIPCLWNVFSRVLLVLLFPIWFPLKKLYAERYKAFELSRYQKVQTQVDKPATTFTWIKMGFMFSFIMFALFAGTEYSINGITPDRLMRLASMNAIGGIFFGTTMWFVLGRKKS